MDTKSTGGSLNSGAASADQSPNPRKKLEEHRRDLVTQRDTAHRRRAQAPTNARRAHEREVLRLDGLILRVDEELSRSVMDPRRVEDEIWRSVVDGLAAQEAAASARAKAGTSEERARAMSSAKTFRTIRECMETHGPSGHSGGSSEPTAAPTLPSTGAQA